MSVKEWTVRLSIEEDGDHTRATAVLVTGEGETTRVEGRARRNPADRPSAEIGEELAVSRALYALADRLMDVAARDIDLAAGHG
jgi:Rv2632c-like